ncbi:MAG: ribosome-associated protein [Bacteroidetes bacterium]|nr:MAG: ribosome-associated protein [Bacteroidota bacterium]
MFLPDLFSELQFKAVRAGGKGGQHVNKVSSRVDLSFAVAESVLLSDEQKNILLEKLANRVNKDGVLKLTEQSDRSQHENKERVIKKFYALLRKALTPVKKRKKSKVPKSVKEKRFQKKKVRSEKKKLRSEKFV